MSRPSTISHKPAVSMSKGVTLGRVRSEVELKTSTGDRLFLSLQQHVDSLAPAALLEEVESDPISSSDSDFRKQCERLTRPELLQLTQQLYHNMRLLSSCIPQNGKSPQAEPVDLVQGGASPAPTVLPPVASSVPPVAHVPAHVAAASRKLRGESPSSSPARVVVRAPPMVSSKSGFTRVCVSFYLLHHIPSLICVSFIFILLCALFTASSYNPSASC